MNKKIRKLDNTAKLFSLEEKDNKNVFRLSAILKKNIDEKVLRSATFKAIEEYPYFKVKLKRGFLWHYFAFNNKDIIVKKDEDNPCKYNNFKKNNGYLFKVTYQKNIINLEIYHALTDGMGAIVLLKQILINYLNLKYKLVSDEKYNSLNLINNDAYLAKAPKKVNYKFRDKKSFLIKQKASKLNNKTYHFILDLDRLKKICKERGVSISEYLTAIYIYAIYKTIYNRNSKKEISVTIPIDLRSRYDVMSLNNFFAVMQVEGHVVNNQKLSFYSLVKHVHNEFKNKITMENIKNKIANDVKLGSNKIINIVPLFIKKGFFKCFGKAINAYATTTLSNIGSLSFNEKYQKYIDNILVSVSSGKFQKIKCTICSYQNKLNVTLNTSLFTSDLEKMFYNLLEKYVGNVKILNPIFY